MTDFYPDEMFIVVEPPGTRGRHRPRLSTWTKLAACDVRPGDWIVVTERNDGRLETRWALVAYVTNDWDLIRVGDRACGYPRLEPIPAIPGKWGRPPEFSVTLPALTYGFDEAVGA